MSPRRAASDAHLGLLLVLATVLAGLLALVAVPVVPGGGSLGFAEAGRGTLVGPFADPGRFAETPLCAVQAEPSPAPSDPCGARGMGVASIRVAPSGSTLTGLAPLRV